VIKEGKGLGDGSIKLYRSDRNSGQGIVSENKFTFIEKWEVNGNI
jgi:hypothetical protein